MKQFKIVVMTNSGTVCIVGQTRETLRDLDGVKVRYQKVALSIEDCHVGTYHRMRVLPGSWLPWVNADMTHRAKSLRVVAGELANAV